MRGWSWNEAALSDAKEPSVRRLEVLGENVKCVGVTPKSGLRDATSTYVYRLRYPTGYGAHGCRAVVCDAPVTESA